MKKDMQTMVTSISFAGGSFIGLCYYLGCCSFLQRLPDEVVTLGCSAGAWAALVLQVRDEIDLNKIKNKLYRFMDSMGHFQFLLEPRLNDLFNDIFRDVPLMFGVRNRLHISVSRLGRHGMRNEMLHGFKDKARLCEALIQSSRLPLLVGSGWTIDGGLTCNQPTLDKRTIKINCITGRLGADISPSGWINPCHILVPPSMKERERLFCMGFEDTRRWFDKETRFKSNATSNPMHSGWVLLEYGDEQAVKRDRGRARDD